MVHKLVSCAIAMVAFFCLGAKAWANLDGKVLALQDGLPRILITPPDKTCQPVQCQIAEDALITLNGKPVHLCDLKPDDDIRVAPDADGVARFVEAIRKRSGILIKTGNPLVVTTDYVNKLPFSLSKYVQVSCNGKPADLSSLQSGDDVSVTPDRWQQVVRIEATRNPLWQ